jgi:hypothetical protein
MVTEENKDDLLEILYRMVEGQLNKAALLAQAKIHLGWDDNTFWDTAKAVDDEKLIELRRAGYVALTFQGHRRAEARFYQPPVFTQNTITVDKIINSPIQQGGTHATMTQTINYSSQDLDDLRRLIGVFENHLDDLALDAASKRKAKAQVVTIKAQLDDDPNLVIVQQAGRTLRNITEGAIASLVATALQPTVWTWAAPLIAKLFGA